MEIGTYIKPIENRHTSVIRILKIMPKTVSIEMYDTDKNDDPILTSFWFDYRFPIERITIQGYTLT